MSSKNELPFEWILALLLQRMNCLLNEYLLYYFKEWIAFWMNTCFITEKENEVDHKRHNKRYNFLK